jgi:gliding motility-associated-like protein
LGCSTSDVVTVFKPDPTFILFTNNDTSYCDIQIIDLAATSNVSPLNYVWLDQNQNIIGEGPTIQVTPGTNACYQVIGTDTLGCQADESVCLTPTFFNFDVSDAQIICLGEEATLCVTDNNNQNLSYTWIPQGCDGTIHAPCITVCPEDTTEYTVIVANNDVGCIDTQSTTITVALFQPSDVIVTADHDTIILTFPIQLFTNQPDNYGYVWSSTNPEDVIPSVGDPTFVPQDSGQVTYTVTVTNEDGCTATGSITFRVLNPACNDSDIFLPTAFTPNSDGHNDYLKVLGEYITGFELHVYSRWGQEVYSTTDPNFNWDGTFKGKKLEPDVFGYYFTAVCVNNAEFSKQGNVTLLR